MQIAAGRQASSPVQLRHSTSLLFRAVGSRMMTEPEATPSTAPTSAPDGSGSSAPDMPSIPMAPSPPAPAETPVRARGRTLPEPWSPSRDGDRRRLIRYRAGGVAEQGRPAHDLADAQRRAGDAAGGRAREQALPAGCRVAEPAARGARLSRSGTRRLRFPGGALAWAGTGDRGLAGRRAWATHRDRVCRQGPRPT